MSNEAADRLRSWLKETIALRLVAADDIALVDDALAAERRATVERMEQGERLIRFCEQMNPLSPIAIQAAKARAERSAILDAEAARE